MAEKTTFPDGAWAGTDHSLDVAMESYTRMMAGITAGVKAGPMGQPEEEDLPFNLSLQGNIGVLSIRGPLMNIDSPCARYYGIATYADIRRALLVAVENPAMQAIFLDIDSGGGAVSGVNDTAALISMIDKNIKPVYSFTEGAMASAAYWLGVSAREVYGSVTALMGSIGVITTLMEYSKAYKEAGVGVNVIRAGKYKALANSAEALTPEARAQVQAQLDSVYGVFINHVATSRSTTVALADETMGQGREFMGQGAVAAGISDGVTTFDALMSKIGAKLLDNAALTQNNARHYVGQPMRTALTEQSIAAIAAGAPAVAALEAPAAAVVPAVEAVVEVAPVAAVAAVTEPEQRQDNGVLDYLRAEVKTGQDRILDLTMQLASATAKVASMEATHAGLVKIAATSTNHMRVALGMASTDLSASTAESLLAEHASASAQFTTKFKAGGVAAVSAETAKPKGPDARHLQRIAATSLK